MYYRMNDSTKIALHIMGNYMIKVLVVEDEAPIRNGIIKHLPWDELDVSEVKSASNAEEALEMAAEFAPDIIISDIRMPGMYGTELCRSYKARNSDCQIIFISGYSDKEYLTTAIDLQVAGYIEKPIDIGELSAAIRKAEGMIAVIKCNKQNSLHSVICDDALLDKRADNAVNTESGIICVGGSDHALVLDLHVKEITDDITAMSGNISNKLKSTLPDDFVKCIVDRASEKDYIIAVILNINFDEDIVATSCDAVMSFRSINSKWFLTCGGETTSDKKIVNVYKKAHRNSEALSFMGWNRSVVDKDCGISEYSGEIDAKAISLFRKNLLEKKAEDARSFIKKERDNLVASRTILNFAVRNVFYHIDHEIAKAEETMHISADDKQAEVSFLDEAETIEAMSDYVLNHLKEYIDSSDEENSNNRNIRLVCDYIYHHMDEEDLSVSALADMVFLTPTYLSGLFKKSTGVTVGRYMTNTRIRKACELFEDPKLKLYQVASMVGYQDSKYFAKQFKKTMGQTPTEYRDAL